VAAPCRQTGRPAGHGLTAMDPFDSDDEYLERQEAAELDGASLDHGGGGGGSSSPERPAAATPKLPATAPAAASARRRYAFGLFLLMLVVVIWVGAAELMEVRPSGEPRLHTAATAHSRSRPAAF